MKQTISGILPALLVPIDGSGKTDIQLLRAQTAYLVQAGAHGIFANGSTAESPYTSTEEKIEVLRTVQEVVAGRIPVYNACIQPSTELVLREIDAISPLKPDYLVVTTPYYYGVSQQTILDHFRAAAAHSSIPVIAYDIPSSTHNRVEYETMIRLPEIGNLAGIKDSSGDFAKFSRAVRHTEGSGFAWIQGDDFLDAVSLMIGAAAVVTGTGNVSLEPYVRLWDTVQGQTGGESAPGTAGTPALVMALQRKIDGLCRVFSETGQQVIPAIKAATALLGRSTTGTRLPGMSVPEDILPAIRAILKEEGLQPQG
jgi:4-hydroxy-tetrahydrodipicolinate synthase